MSSVLHAGRRPRSLLIRVYTYDKNHIEKDGEPLGYVRIIATREKGEGYSVPTIINGIFEQMGSGNWIGASYLPTMAYRIAPNMYVHTSPVYNKLFNLTGLCKHNQTGQYLLHNMVYLCGDVPSRKEMFHMIQQAFNSGIPPTVAELWQIQDCLTDSWANVGTQIETHYTLWVHLKAMEQEKYVSPSTGHRSLEEIIDDGEPGDTYLRSKML